MSPIPRTLSSAPHKLFLLGVPGLHFPDDRPVPGMGPGKPLAMLAFLAVNGSASREQLVALFWPEIPEARARNAFRQTLHRLRGALGPDRLRSERDLITLDNDAGLWCDAIEFAGVINSDPERAIELYRGPFLQGVNVGSSQFEQWADSHRERIEAQYRGALANAANRALEAGRTDAAAAHAAALSRASPLDQDAALLEARILAGAGRKAEAVSILTRHSAQVESELGGTPSAGVRSMLHRLLNESPPVVRTSAGSADQLAEAEFAGREKELGRLLSLWRGIDRQGAMAVVTGPQGIGRTRLVSELVQRVHAFGAVLTLWGQERHGNRSIPYAALADALRPAVTAPGLAGASQSLLAEAARLLPEIRDQFDLPVASPIDDETGRIRFFEGIAALLDAVAYEQPVCLVVEDLHHSSRSSLRLLDFLAGRLVKSPVLFVVSFRPAEASSELIDRFSARAPGAPGAHGRTTEMISLGPLAPASVRRLIESAAAGPGPSDEILDSIVDMAAGNPFRALDLLRRARRGESFTNLPAELGPALWARLQSCSPAEQRLFLACALLERAAPLQLLSAATHLPEPTAFDAAISLEQRGLVVQRRGGIAPAHDVLADLALEGSGSAGRALLAGWTADAVAAEPGASHAELARLYATAGQPSSAHRHARAAVHDAAAAGAREDLHTLLGLAAETALNSQDRIAVQSLRTAFGGDTRRITGRHDAPFREAAPAEAPGAPEAPAGATGGAASATGRTSPRITRRTAAIATGVAALALASAALLLAPATGAYARGTVLSDSLVVAERIGARETRSYVVTGAILPSASLAGDVEEGLPPPWVTALARPWLNARVSPDRRLVAVERITPGGTVVHVIGADRRDTIIVGRRSGNNVAAGWSPDSRWLLVVEEEAISGSYHSSLHAYSVDNPEVGIGLDTTSTHTVIEAAWSPRGPEVAWTARTGESRDQDVFVGLSDGSRTRNVSNSASEDYHPAWSPDGARLVFTSERDGNAELYSFEIESGELRRLTFDPAQDERGRYSPDGDFIAFESTRGGRTGVYVMPPLGGIAIRLTPPDRNFALVRWRGRTPPYIARLRVALPDRVALGESASVTATGIDQFGAPIALPEVEWHVLDNTAELSLPMASVGAGANRSLVGRRAGMARVSIRSGAWRADTGFTVVGESPVTIVDEEFSEGLDGARWAALGVPRPFVSSSAGLGGGKGLVLRASRQWESGILATTVVPLRRGLTARARFRAPFTALGATGGFTFALVAAEAPELVDTLAPQLLKLAAISWLPESGRLGYSAEGDFWSESVRFQRDNDWHDFRIEVEADGRLAFYVGGRLRRRSNIVVTRPDGDPRVQLWVGGRGTGESVVVDDVLLRIAARANP